ncbi:FadR family transcriptional regulator [bacterium]|nr:MAG: FadR family transcriptional regulator [bacterium]
MAVLVSLQRFRLSDQIVDLLAGEIISGRLQADESLPSEPQLVERFRASKVVIRESIQKLAGLGLIRVSWGKRTVVLDEREWNILAAPVQRAYVEAGRAVELLTHLYEARLIVEPAAAEHAAARATADERDDLLTIVKEMRAISTGSHDTQRFLKVDRDFHDAVARMGRNAALRAVLRDLHATMSQRWLNSKITPAELEVLVGQHQKVAEAIRLGDRNGARAAMAEHIAWAADLETSRAAREASHDPLS